MGSRSKRYKQEADHAGNEPVSLGEAVEKVKSFKAKFDQTLVLWGYRPVAIEIRAGMQTGEFV